jgi:hypothetical protein
MDPQIYEEPNRLVYELARRTLHNLHEGTVKFEATQLLNSLTGLLIFPVERFKDRLKATCSQSYAIFENAGWPQIEFMLGGDRTAQKLDKVLHSLRNSVAHGKFILNHNKGLIQSIIFFDQSPRETSPHWKIQIRLSALQAFVGKLAKLVRVVAYEQSLLDDLALEAKRLEGVGSNKEWTDAYKAKIRRLSNLYDAKLIFDERNAIPANTNEDDFSVLVRLNWASGASYERELQYASQQKTDLRVVIYDAQLRKFKNFQNAKKSAEADFSDGSCKRYLLVAQQGHMKSGLDHHAWFS